MLRRTVRRLALGASRSMAGADVDARSAVLPTAWKLVGARFKWLGGDYDITQRLSCAIALKRTGDRPVGLAGRRLEPPTWRCLPPLSAIQRASSHSPAPSPSQSGRPRPPRHPPRPLPRPRRRSPEPRRICLRRSGGVRFGQAGRCSARRCRSCHARHGQGDHRYPHSFRGHGDVGRGRRGGHARGWGRGCAGRH